MASIGLSVPPGLTISTEACHEYQQIGNKLPLGLWEEILEGLKFVEKDMGAFLGDPSKPLLLSVRSGAAVRLSTLSLYRATTQATALSFCGLLMMIMPVTSILFRFYTVLDIN
jgi:phosphoenolpyruvate synthase/pyruvate phosphate dikinase